MSGQIAIQLISIKKAQKFLNSWMVVWLYTIHSAILTQTQTQRQMESEAFKTHENMTKTLLLAITGMFAFIEVILGEMYKWSGSW